MKYIIPFAIFICLGILFLGQGITGMVVDEAPQINSHPLTFMNYVWIFAGIKLVVFFSFLIYRRIRHKPLIPFLNLLKHQ